MLSYPTNAFLSNLRCWFSWTHVCIRRQLFADSYITCIQFHVSLYHSSTCRWLILPHTGTSTTFWQDATLYVVCFPIRLRQRIQDFIPAELIWQCYYINKMIVQDKNCSGQQSEFCMLLISFFPVVPPKNIVLRWYFFLIKRQKRLFSNP